MVGHINIENPEQTSRIWERRREVQALRDELKSAYAERDNYRENLTSIFDRLERGEPVELWLDHSRAMVVTAYEKRGRGWPSVVEKEPAGTDGRAADGSEQ